jgi:hypothetical protein
VTAPVTELTRQILWTGALGVAALVIVVMGLWYFVLRVLRDPIRAVTRRTISSSDPTPLHNMETVPAPSRMR